MTLLIGFINKSSAYLIVDSAITFPGAALNYSAVERSPFGETIIANDEKLVSDNSQKLYQFDGSVMAAFAGLVFEGEMVMDDIANELQHRKHERLSTTILNYLTSHPPEQTDYLFGFMEDETPKIIYYDNRDEFGFVDPNSSIVVGSAVEIDYFRTGIHQCIADMKSVEESPMGLLVAVVGMAQLYSLNLPTLASGVGGTYNGAFVSSEGISWADDTCYLIYSSKHFDRADNFFVTKYNRLGATVLGSSKDVSETKSIITRHALKNKNVNDVMQKLASIGTLHRKLEANYYVALSYDRLILTVLGKSCNGQMKLEVDEKGINFMFSPFLQKILFRTDEPDDGLMPIARIHFC